MNYATFFPARQPGLVFEFRKIAGLAWQSRVVRIADQSSRSRWSKPYPTVTLAHNAAWDTLYQLENA